MLSLKLSELQVIYDDIGEYPILLLDDFMSELDEKKKKKTFLENIKNIQVIITCTDKIVLENLDYFLYNVVDGKIIKKKKSKNILENFYNFNNIELTKRKEWR